MTQRQQRENTPLNQGMADGYYGRPFHWIRAKKRQRQRWPRIATQGQQRWCYRAYKAGYRIGQKQRRWERRRRRWREITRWLSPLLIVLATIIFCVMFYTAIVSAASQ